MSPAITTAAATSLRFQMVFNFKLLLSFQAPHLPETLFTGEEFGFINPSELPYWRRQAGKFASCRGRNLAFEHPVNEKTRPGGQPDGSSHMGAGVDGRSRLI